jgi:hypothetical protein
MFILAYEAIHENQIILGVYSSLDTAMIAVQRYTRDDPDSVFYRDLVIRQFTVDAEPRMDTGIVVWDNWREEE